MKKLLVLFSIIILASCAPPKDVVTGVTDGDTIYAVVNGEQITIRLAGIDSPEKSQAFGKAAKQFTADLLMNKPIKIVPRDTDQYGRTIADIYLPDSTWVNLEIVKAGFAWHYKRYSDDQELASAELDARRLQAGLWKDLNSSMPPQAPWQFRRHKT